MYVFNGQNPPFYIYLHFCLIFFRHISGNLRIAGKLLGLPGTESTVIKFVNVDEGRRRTQGHIQGPTGLVTLLMHFLCVFYLIRFYPLA